MKHQANKIYRWKLIMLTSLSAFLFVTLACTQESSPNKGIGKTQEEREVFTKVEEQPSYEGGMDAFYKYLISETNYPLLARNSGTEGIVQVQFFIERNGSISNATAMSSIGSGCDQEAIRVIENAPDFIPGSQRGRTVRTTMTMPITFKLNQEKRNADNSIQGIIIAGKVAIEHSELSVTADYNNGKWSGKILSIKGDKMPGANIVVAGTNYGTVSDLSGTFSVKANQDQELHISYIGYNDVVIKK